MEAGDQQRHRMYTFVYQEWDMMRERIQVREERLEKPSPTISNRTHAFSIQLQEARIKQRITIRELADRCGVTPRSMSLYENGTEMPSTIIQQRIKEVLNIE